MCVGGTPLFFWMGLPLEININVKFEGTRTVLFFVFLHHPWPYFGDFKPEWYSRWRSSIDVDVKQKQKKKKNLGFNLGKRIHVSWYGSWHAHTLLFLHGVLPWNQNKKIKAEADPTLVFFVFLIIPNPFFIFSCQPVHPSCKMNEPVWLNDC